MESLLQRIVEERSAAITRSSTITGRVRTVVTLTRAASTCLKTVGAARAEKKKFKISGADCVIQRHRSADRLADDRGIIRGSKLGIGRHQGDAGRRLFAIARRGVGPCDSAEDGRSAPRAPSRSTRGQDARRAAASNCGEG
jgi:hypothetical protein